MKQAQDLLGLLLAAARISAPNAPNAPKVGAIKKHKKGMAKMTKFSQLPPMKKKKKTTTQVEGKKQRRSNNAQPTMHYSYQSATVSCPKAERMREEEEDREWPQITLEESYTLKAIAKVEEVNLKQLVEWNVVQFPRLTASSTLKCGTTLLLPREFTPEELAAMHALAP